ncbi:pantoate--beta-alanine ligase [Brachybacterium alimentarium]|uniref:pantoate--beta-alanine ligase n=1 Tax=Brachybacterium alimentarium TaxID=47845 RepID=UPI000DF2142C|nr:pantoate--beta-alanine ligase [Brachybacterium alimentarium]RCS69710.1 pantoate--beta-alanine ligase [Brachybacterium alimentarium]RCS89513.1 pantoate--beta-alanine ligase [Brachybacterium alimentarium]
MITTPQAARPAGDGPDRTTALITTKTELRARRARLEGTVAAVFTMGALHEGHLALVARARELADHVLLTDFVNPLQFGPGEDYEAYPRDLDADLAVVDGLVDLVFAPAVEEMYPVLPPTVSVTAGRAGTILEGAARPGHFDGVVTVVTKLLQLTSPQLAVFGRKDAQQLAIIQRLVADLDLPVRIEPVEIHREASGLARSSRNAYLSDRGREQALALSRTIAAARDAAPSAAAVRRALVAAVDRAEIDWDYALALDPATLEEITADHRGEALVVLAGRVEDVRLLDAAVVVATAD